MNSDPRKMNEKNALKAKNAESTSQARNARMIRRASSYCLSAFPP